MTPPAPLYVRCYDLTRYLLERTSRFPKNQRFVLARRVEAAAFDLVESVSIALQEPEGRALRLRRADEALVRLRLGLRLCGDLALLRDNQAAFAQREMIDIGKMLGGWRKKELEKLSHAGPPS